MNIINWLRDIWTNIQSPGDQDELEMELWASNKIESLHREADALRSKIELRRRQKKAVKPLQQELERTVQEILRQETDERPYEISWETRK